MAVEAGFGLRRELHRLLSADERLLDRLLHQGDLGHGAWGLNLAGSEGCDCARCGDELGKDKRDGGLVVRGVVELQRDSSAG